MNKSRDGKRRMQRGQVLTALILFVGLFMIGAIGLLAFEMCRYSLAREQLRTCVDAASLAAEATLNLQTDPWKMGQGQQSAINCALQIFRQNSVLGNTLTSALLSPNLPLNPLANQGLLHVDFLDTVNKQPQPLGSVLGRVVRVTGAYGVVPAFGRFLGLNVVNCQTASFSSVPKIDLATCFDAGGPADDSTIITMVRRVWVPGGGPNGGKTAYQPVPMTDGSGNMAEGPLNQVLCVSGLGVDVNATFPQGLEQAAGGFTGISGLNCPQGFNRRLRSTLGLSPFQPNFTYTFPAATPSPGWPANGVNPESGKPPGNFPPNGNEPLVGFTDLVVNLDGNNHFNSFTGSTGTGSWGFPSTGALVEAARGNLESQAIANAAKVDWRGMGVTPRPGYFGAYNFFSTSMCAPYAQAKQACLDFNDAVRKTTDAQFALQSFDDQVPTGQYHAYFAPNISSNYPAGGQSWWYLSQWNPQVITDPMYQQISWNAFSTHNYGNSMGGFLGVGRGGGGGGGSGISDFPGGINSCITSVASPNGRWNAKKVVVFYTNSAPLPGQMVTIRAAAVRARDLAIPIYAVCYATNPFIASVQNDIFNDWNNNSASGGVCAIAGHGGRYYQLSDPKLLHNTFGNIMRQLTALTL